jgi:predicted nucleic acid-binding protein
MLTTRDVLVEVANAMSKLRFRSGAMTTLRAFEADPLIEIVERTPELYRAAFDLFSKRMDKEWSLTDCLSFVVMQQRGLTEALTPDEHFVQAGFKALLRD